jgi:hypothetical protein
MNKSVLLILFFALAMEGCFLMPGDRYRPQDWMNMEYFPEVNSKTDVDSLDGKKVAVIGIYEQMNVAKRPGAEPSYIGRANVILSDSTYVMIESGDEGIRQKKEIKSFDGKRVRIEGTLYKRRNAWGDGTQATIVGACVNDITSISLSE